MVPIPTSPSQLFVVILYTVIIYCPVQDFSLGSKDLTTIESVIVSRPFQRLELESIIISKIR